MQVVQTDPKGFLPTAASGLAVRSVAGETEYIGSFDALLRVSATTPGPWRSYHDEEVALDVKVTGAGSTLGLNGLTMKSYLTHARAVIQAARKERARVGGVAR